MQGGSQFLQVPEGAGVLMRRVVRTIQAAKPEKVLTC